MQRVEALLDKDLSNVIRGINGHFLRDPALIFIALVKLKYKSEATIGFEVAYDP